MISDTEKYKIGRTFATGLSTRNGELLASIMDENVAWNMPGNSLLSGEAPGIDAVVKRAQMIVDYGMKFEVEHIQLGLNGVALSLHNSARRGDLIFDEHLVTVLGLREGKVRVIDTYMPDVPMLDAFFVPVQASETATS